MILHVNMHAVYMYMYVSSIHDFIHVHTCLRGGGREGGEGEGIFQGLGNI